MPKIYTSGGTFIIEDLFTNPDILTINTSNLDWSIDNDEYIVRDKIENQSYRLGTFNSIINEFDVPFASDEEIKKFLNSSINIQSPNSNISARLKDIIGNDVLATVFGDLITAGRRPSITAQFGFGLNVGNSNPREDDAKIIELNGGNVQILDSELLISSGTSNNGESSIESNDYVRYLPGFEIFLMFTLKFDPPDINPDIQRGGLFDSQNGFFLEYDSSGFYFVRRKLGVDYPLEIDIDSIFPDKSFNPEKSNIYFLKYGYLGSTTITIIAANPNNGFNQVAKIKYSGIFETIHTTQTFLPLRGEVKNIGSTINKTIKVGSVSAGVVIAFDEYPATRRFTKDFIGSVVAGTTLIGIFRNKTIFSGIENRIEIQIMNFTAAFDGTKPIEFVIKRNPIITTPGTWNDVDVNSTVEFSTDSVINSNSGRLMKSFNISKSGNIDILLKELRLFLRSGEWFSIELITTGLGDYNCSVNWEENF